MDKERKALSRLETMPLDALRAKGTDIEELAAHERLSHGARVHRHRVGRVLGMREKQMETIRRRQQEGDEQRKPALSKRAQYDEAYDAGVKDNRAGRMNARQFANDFQREAYFDGYYNDPRKPTHEL